MLSRLLSRSRAQPLAWATRVSPAIRCTRTVAPVASTAIRARAIHTRAVVAAPASTPASSELPRTVHPAVSAMNVPTPYERLGVNRGKSDVGWLNAKYSFSFSPMFRDDAHRGFRKLRVINEDRVGASKGFDTHGHVNMEIITYVLSGSITHKDSMNNTATIQAGEVQRMSAGRGVTHSEVNPSADTECHLLQIWIHPRETGLQPSYQQSCFTDDDKRTALKLIASADGADGSIVINQDCKLYAALLGDLGQSTTTHYVGANRHVYLHVVKGGVTVSYADGSANGFNRSYVGGDGLGLSPPWKAASADGTTPIKITVNSKEEAEILLFDLA